MIVLGATMSGKIEQVKRLLAHEENMMILVPKKVLSCYKYWQPCHTEILKTMLEITFHQGMLDAQSQYFDPNVPSLIVFDDLMRTVMNDDTAADLFTEGAHHRNITVVFIIKNLFFQGKQSRTIILNAHRCILLKNPRDRWQAEAFGRQVYPRKSNTFSEAYEKATKRPHGYLVVDMYPTAPNSCRLRTKTISFILMTYFIPSVLLLSHLKRRITWSLQNYKQCITVRNK